MHKVLRYFEDLKDNRHKYNPGDIFPRAGLAVSSERLEELSTEKNKRGVCLIREEADPVQEVKPRVREVKPETRSHRRNKCNAN